MNRTASATLYICYWSYSFQHQLKVLIKHSTVCLIWSMSYRFCKEPNHVPLRCEEVEKQHQKDTRTFLENKMTEAMVRLVIHILYKMYLITWSPWKKSWSTLSVSHNPFSGGGKLRNQRWKMKTSQTLLHLIWTSLTVFSLRGKANDWTYCLRSSPYPS